MVCICRKNTLETSKKTNIEYALLVFQLGIYGLLMSVGSLSGNLFLNFTISTLADLPSGILLGALADRVGCKRLLTVSALGMGVACCTMAFVPDKEYPSAVLALYFIGKVFASLSLNACWAYTSELYPTNLRY